MPKYRNKCTKICANWNVLFISFDRYLDDHKCPLEAWEPACLHMTLMRRAAPHFLTALLWWTEASPATAPCPSKDTGSFKTLCASIPYLPGGGYQVFGVHDMCHGTTPKVELMKIDSICPWWSPCALPWSPPLLPATMSIPLVLMEVQDVLKVPSDWPYLPRRQLGW